MKTSLATSISIVGVLAAGGVALAVNTSVLDSATMTAENAPALQAEVLPITSSDDGQGVLSSDPVAAQAAETDGAPATVVSVDPTGTTIPSSPSTLVAPTPSQSASPIRTAYNVQGFGVVTLEQSTNTLTVVSVTAESGVKHVVKQESQTRIEVLFTSAAGIGIKFHADVMNGRTITSVMNEQPPRSLKGQKREDHDDDEHEEDEHEEEHESGEHDDD